MDEKNQEVYERIPWESLEKQGGDRQWLILGIAGAVVAGSLGYSFMSNRPAPLPPPPTEAAAAVTAPPTTFTPVAPAPAPAPAQPAPSLVTEADLYAVDPDHLAVEAAAHARWVVREFLASDGSAQQGILRSLLPADIPLPSTPEGVLVFVEWVDSVGVEEIDVGTYRVDVLARYMVSADGGDYQRVDPELFALDIAMADGTARLVGAPVVKAIDSPATAGLGLGAVPDSVAAAVAALRPGSEIVGGYVDPGGTWNVVILAAGPGGVIRPEMVPISP
ncbi:MAG: hypothetical protein ACFCU2_01185 [Acidimicrobiia bacterium]